MAKDRIYWDSDCFLGWIKNESDKIKGCRDTIERGIKGELLIVTSAITLTEVVRRKKKSQLEPTQDEKIKSFFQNPYIRIVNLDRFIDESARKLMWQKVSLSNEDAIHAASAIFYDIEELNTFERPLLSLNGQLDLASKNTKLLICKPRVSPQIDMFEHEKEKE